MPLYRAESTAMTVERVTAHPTTVTDCVIDNWTPAEGEVGLLVSAVVVAAGVGEGVGLTQVMFNPVNKLPANPFLKVVSSLT